MIEPLLCTNCNALLALRDAAFVECSFCGTTNTIPPQHREALCLTRDLDEATKSALRAWSHLNQKEFPRWLFVSAAVMPFVLLTGGLALILAVGLVRPESSRILPLLVGAGVWIPLIPAQALAANIGMKQLLVSGAASVGLAFAAAPPMTGGAAPNCRQCGAPLSVRPDDILVRCAYCQAESIVSLRPTAMHNLESRVGSARSSLAEAMAALDKRTRLVKIETQGRTYVIAGLLILPLVWSFVGSFQTSNWSILIAIDVWLLGVCIFWNVREALLPQVTIEELNGLLETRVDSASDNDQVQVPVNHPAGTRGWYDHAFDKRNFVIPMVVAAMFVAIELLVLKV